MEHDLAGLEAALARNAHLEEALAQLCYFRNHYGKELTPRQQEFLKTAMHTTACVLNDLLGGVSDDD